MENVEIMENGNLKISLGQEERNEYNLKLNKNFTYILSELLEAYSANGSFTQIYAEDIGALTEAPIIAKNAFLEDDGTLNIESPIWWLPDYQIKNDTKELVEKGFIIFKNIPQ